jgi:hypothetical protein
MSQSEIHNRESGQDILRTRPLDSQWPSSALYLASDRHEVRQRRYGRTDVRASSPRCRAGPSDECSLTVPVTWGFDVRSAILARTRAMRGGSELRAMVPGPVTWGSSGAPSEPETAFRILACTGHRRPTGSPTVTRSRTTATD